MYYVRYIIHYMRLINIRDYRSWDSDIDPSDLDRELTADDMRLLITRTFTYIHRGVPYSVYVDEHCYRTHIPHPKNRLCVIQLGKYSDFRRAFRMAIARNNGCYRPQTDFAVHARDLLGRNPWQVLRLIRNT